MARSREELLQDALGYVAREGLSEFSLRGCAEAIGTSHRMLAYHFGSRDGLVAAVADAAAQRCRGIIEQMVADRDLGSHPLTLPEIEVALDRFYRHSDLPGLLPVLVEVSYLIARRSGAGLFSEVDGYEGLVPLWQPVLEGVLGLADLPPERAQARLRLALAVMVGLGVDYLGTRDVESQISAQREWARLVLGV